MKYVVTTYLFGYRDFDSFKLLKWHKKSHRQKIADVIQGFCFSRRQSRRHLPNADVS